jgi:quinol monooxygenase YgiN
MNSKPLTVVAIVKAKPGKEAEVKQELLALIGPTRREAGCLNYDLHQDLADPARFIFHENWTSQAHLEAHANQPHLQALFAKAPDLLSEPMQLILADKIG